MPKKNKHQQVDVTPDYNEIIVAEDEEQPLFETEAYGSPQPDAGQDVTVMKTVGIGGPVPIVAPKHNTVQLQPIIVPLAVVPYMTQDSSVLRTDGKPSGGFAGDGEYAEATDFESVGSVAQTKRRVKNSTLARIFSLVSFLLSAIIVIPYVLAYFYPVLGDKIFLSYLNVIGDIIAWVGGTAPTSIALTILFLVGATMAAVGVISSLIGIIAGKYPRIINIAASLLCAAPLLAVMIYLIVDKAFLAQYHIILIVLVALSLLAFILSFVFTLVLNKREDSDTRHYYDSEI